MDYTNLDELFKRANEFKRMSDDIFEAKEEELQNLEFSITHDPSLLKIYKITKILKDANIKNFDSIKNIDSNFIWDADKIIIKSNTNPIRLYLTFNSEENCFNSEVFGYDNASDLYKFYNKVIDNIKNYENMFIAKINEIFKKQDAEYREFFPE